MSNLSKVDFLIIGGGIAGTTAAETIRQRSEGSIMIVTDEKHALYSRVRLPDYVAGLISREKVFIKEEGWYRKNGIEILRETSVKGLSPTEQRIYLSNGGIVQYRRLLLSTGGFARKLRCEGSDLGGLHYLRTIEDAESIQCSIQTSKKAVVIGGGFIGLELTRCFIQRGLETVVVMMEPQFWPRVLDQESGGMIEQALRAKGAIIHYSDQIRELKGNGNVQRVVLASGKELGCDIGGIGIGIKTIHPFIAASGLKMQRGILTDEYLRTSAPHVFAAGDVVEFYDVGRKQHNQMGNWSNATEQGKVSASNLLGEESAYRFVSNYVIRVFGLSIGFVGNPTLLPGTDIIRRGSPNDGGYVRLLVREGVVKGATLLNRLHEMRPIIELITGNVRIDRYRSHLTDVHYDLESLSSGCGEQPAL